MKPDYRKKRLVYRGLEYSFLTGDITSEEFNTLLTQYHARQLSDEHFSEFYWLGVDASYHDE